MVIHLDPELERYAQDEARRRGLDDAQQYVRHLIEEDRAHREPSDSEYPSREQIESAYAAFQEKMEKAFPPEKREQLRRDLETYYEENAQRDLEIAREWEAAEDDLEALEDRWHEEKQSTATSSR